MVIRPPDSIFQRIVSGQLRLCPKDFLPRKTLRGEIPARFPAGRTARLRTKLLAIGIDPITVGLPPQNPPNTQIFIPPAINYRDACREIKYCQPFKRNLTQFRYDFVKQQVARMEQTVDEWRQVTCSL